jgi:hypothetical protein
MAAALYDGYAIAMARHFGKAGRSFPEPGIAICRFTAVPTADPL